MPQWYLETDDMSFDEGLLARCLDHLSAMRVTNVRTKNVFGMRGLLRGKTMFAAVGTDGIVIKVAVAEYDSAIEQDGIRAFSPGGQKLGNWVEIGEAVVADDPELRSWLEAGLRAIR